MNTALFMEYCAYLALLLILGGFLVALYRLYVGPSLPDRILALDLMVNFGVGFIIVMAILSTYSLFVDVALALGLVGFLATVAFARFVMRRGGGLMAEEDAVQNEGAMEGEKSK